MVDISLEVENPTLNCFRIGLQLSDRIIDHYPRLNTKEFEKFIVDHVIGAFGVPKFDTRYTELNITQIRQVVSEPTRLADGSRVTTSESPNSTVGLVHDALSFAIP